MDSEKKATGTESANSGPDLGSNQLSDKFQGRGNGEQVEADSQYNALVAKAKAAAESHISEREGYYPEHGDVGTAGSYRIDWKVKS